MTTPPTPRWALLNRAVAEGRCVGGVYRTLEYSLTDDQPETRGATCWLILGSPFYLPDFVEFS